MHSDVIAWLSSALPSLPIDPSGPGLPDRAVLLARRLVRRSASARRPEPHQAIAGRGLVRSARFRRGRPRSRSCPRPRGAIPPPMNTRSFMSVVTTIAHPFADVADAVLVGHARVGEVDLVELGAARHLAQRPDLDAGLVHVEDEVGEPLVLLARRDWCGRRGSPTARGARATSTPSGRSRSTRRRRARRGSRDRRRRSPRPAR